MARAPRTVMTKAVGPFFPTRPSRVEPLTAPRERRERKPPSIFKLREEAGEKAAEAAGVEVSASAAQAIVKHVQDSGKTGAEAGYILERLIASASSGEVKKPELLATLSTEQKKWYDKQVGQYQDLMTECKARYKAELQVLKDKCGDDARKYTNARLKLKAKIYPDWSSQAKQAEAKFEERQDKLAAAISAAKKAGVTGLSYDEIYSLATTSPTTAKKWGAELGLDKEQIATIRDVGLEELYKPEDIAGTRITLTDKEIPRELRKASPEEQEGLGIKKVGGKWQQDVVVAATGQYIPATLFDPLPPNQQAEVIAAPVGTMIGAGAGAILIPEIEEKPVVTIEATAEEKKKAKDARAEAEARGWSCYAQIHTFKVKLKDGTTILVEAFSESSAEQKAKDAGYKPAWVTRMMSGESIEPAKTPTGAYNVTGEDGETVTMVPFEHPETGETLLIARDAAAELKDTKAYKDAKGTDEQRLGIAHAAAQKELDEWLTDLKNKSPDLYELYQEQGYDAMVATNERLQKQQQDILAKLNEYKSAEEGYDITTALLDEAATPDELKLAGFSESTVNEAAMNAIGIYPRLIRTLLPEEEWQKLEEEFQALPTKKQDWYMNERNAFAQYVPESPLTEGSYNKLSDEHKKRVLEWYYTSRPQYHKEQALATGRVALAFVPIAGTIAYWDDMSPAMKALSIAGDILFFVPLIHGAAVGARAAKGYTAGARMQAALRGAGKMALAELTAPADFLSHPIETTKGIGRQIQSTIETLVHPKKLPLGGVELAYTTTRLPVEDVGGAKKAIQLRDTAVMAAIQGKPGTATVGSTTLTLTPSELQKVGGAVGIHNTPDIRPYLNGAVVKGGAEGSGLFLSPNLHSRFAQATAFGDIPEGGIKGGLIIRDKNILRALAPSGKTYMSTVEIEAILKPGTVLPPPSQVLFTRDAAGHRLTLLVIGKPFTPAQVAKLKFLGSLDTVGQIFKPTLSLSGAQKTAISSMDDIISLSRDRAAIAQQLTAARTAGRAAQVQALSQRISGMDQKIENLIGRVNAPREIIRPSNVAWAEYVDKGLLDRWRELNPGKAQRTARGTRLPDIEATRLIKGTRLTEAARRVPAEERRVPAYTRLHPPTYTTEYAPKYAPEYVPPYAPVDVPPYAPAYTPPYVPPTPPYVPPHVPPYAPPYVPRHAPPPAPKRTRSTSVPTKLGRERMPKPGQSLQVWDQGIYWISIFEPFRTTGAKPDVVYSRDKPPWAGRIAKGRHSPQKTFRAIGRRHPKLVKLPMGAVTVHVKNGRRLIFSRRRS